MTSPHRGLRPFRAGHDPLHDDPEPSNTGARFAASVGTLTHRLIGEALAYRRAGRGDPREIVLARSQTLATAAGLGHRTRACRIAVAAGAAIYLERLMLPPAWTFDGAELRIAGEVRADIVWSGRPGIVIDEIKSADARVAGRISAARDDQVGRLLEAGTLTYGDRLVGIRLIFLGAVGHSLLYRVGRPVGRLADDAGLGPREVEPWQ